MKVKFVCDKHSVRLVGEPLWYQSEGGVWTPDLSKMWCPTFQQEWGETDATEEYEDALAECLDSWGMLLRWP